MKTPGLIDLHLHLDGSLSVKSVKELAALQNIEIPENEEELLKLLRINDDCKDLTEYLEKFAFPGMLLQTKEAVALSLFFKLFLKVINGKSNGFLGLKKHSRESEFFKIFGKVLAIVVDSKKFKKFFFVFGNFNVLQSGKFLYGFYGKGTVKMKVKVDKSGCFHCFCPPAFCFYYDLTIYQKKPYCKVTNKGL